MGVKNCSEKRILGYAGRNRLKHACSLARDRAEKAIEKDVESIEGERDPIEDNASHGVN